jgi:alpha-ribazole phosphatase
MTTLWLIRHGETDWNLSKRIQGSADEPLNATGTQQASCLAARLAAMNFDAIYASDLLRVQQTAKHALNGTMNRVQSDARLREVGFGKWEGLTWDEIKVNHADDYALWDVNRNETPHGGEKLVDVIARVDSFMQELRERHVNREQVMIFAHGGTIAILISLLLGVDPSKWWQFSLKNCALSEVRLVNRGAILLRLNDDSHLSTTE